MIKYPIFQARQIYRSKDGSTPLKGKTGVNWGEMRGCHGQGGARSSTKPRMPTTPALGAWVPERMAPTPAPVAGGPASMHNCNPRAGRARAPGGPGACCLSGTRRAAPPVSDARPEPQPPRGAGGVHRSGAWLPLPRPRPLSLGGEQGLCFRRHALC